ncbi:MAG: hypothetical protein LC808_40895 [Actinobacteria bacterium]|nr:hypothetical protein [Actinomycetota bacterium]
MPIDLTALAGDIAAILSPALPFLRRPFEEVADRASQALGDRLWAKISAVWARIRGPVEKAPAATAAMDTLEATPQDASALLELRAALVDILRSEPGIVDDLAPLVASARGDSSGSSSVNAQVQWAKNIVSMNTAIGDVHIGDIIHQSPKRSS